MEPITLFAQTLVDPLLLEEPVDQQMVQKFRLAWHLVQTARKYHS